jgi:hypothetical protein
MQHPNDQQNIVNPGIIPCVKDKKLLVSDRTPMSAALKDAATCKQCAVEAVSVA